MKKIFLFNTAILISVFTFFSCSKKSDPVPQEQELITTLQVLVTDSNGVEKTFQYKVINGFGSDSSVVEIDTIKLKANTTYAVVVKLLNEKASPIEDITQEVIAENTKHLFLYNSTPSTGAGAIQSFDGNKDDANLPFNQTIKWLTDQAGQGNMGVYLIHLPTVKNGTTLEAVGGTTDVEALFPVVLSN